MNSRVEMEGGLGCCRFEGLEFCHTPPIGFDRSDPDNLGYPVGKVEGGIRLSSEGGREEINKEVVVSSCLI